VSPARRRGQVDAARRAGAPAARPRRDGGIAAVDPSSRRSGGALLGDRVRVRASAHDPGVFLRSMAARERLGGLADATWAGVTVLAAVFDHVFVETVGVGQSEAEVADLADTLLFVAQPTRRGRAPVHEGRRPRAPRRVRVNKADLGPVPSAPPASCAWVDTLSREALRTLRGTS
jgi:LAO/AO transport system kinase